MNPNRRGQRARRYAQGTTVPVAISREAIGALLEDAGASRILIPRGIGDAFVGFVLADRVIRLRLALPTTADFSTRRMMVAGVERTVGNTPNQALAAREKETRRLWRSLFLVLKAKLEAAASGVETIEEAFMAHVVVAGGRTVGQEQGPAIEEAYKLGAVPLLVAGPGL